ncbi:oxygen-insensitive NAD(P)H nitroreductase [Shewanella dokdonensis]|uniref:Oxygen-insensitive NAD(P)H nitroreductase n=1 Tax=Shewanella dokdonensis TaxID=712036 RepID=A0ABX8DGV6_9GAMM|nr:oxygen-insensitive NAD(P)H nitroreductase [Shewanella dokdonensis]MCL1074286.1 oxygen-insensitive NAD(P)H nitroreductase [Shewanella dokdonensis]QVK23989.1 oxygen-insensitive NAD(P)H nitroreductase [Shewanella dokdonensis]
MTDLTTIVKRRYTSKALDPNKKIPQEKIDQLKTLLQFAPSSVNSQPWHFVIAATAEGKAKVAEATVNYAFNTPKILNASHVVVLCTRNYITDEYLEHLADQEQQDGRIPDEAARQALQNGRKFFVNMHRYEQKDLQHWMEKQTYLALGTLLLGASVLEIGATPIEGFDATTLNKVLGLREQGLNASVIVALGYSDASDFNAKLPKSRLPQHEVINEI